MIVITLHPMEAEPTGEDVTFYPDFLVYRLIQKGIGEVEADRKLQHDDKIDFTYTARQTGHSELLASIPAGSFRPLLARLGPRFGADQMLYTGHTLFAVEHECEGKKRLHRFSLYVCNEPTMAIWMKLYFYCIDGIWPMREKESS